MNDIKITLENLSVAEVNLLMAGLGKLPLETTVDLWMKIKAQGESQIAAKQNKPDDLPAE